MSSTRQLAAIMFTDIVGYTALMGKDEQKAFELLTKNRQIQKPIIEEFNGKWIKELGDGVMASFTTVSDAVNAAIKIQQTCNASNEYQLRIGIHLGEVVFENDDVFGDGVNIASRIQAIAQPGSIFVSESVHKSIANKPEFQTKFFTEQKLKNVKEPVRIYQVIANGVAIARQQIGERIRPKRNIVLVLSAILIILIGAYFLKEGLSGSKDDQLRNTIVKSIAVLPFEDMSPNHDQQWFSDGLTEGILNSLAKVKNLKVPARTSSFQFRGKNVDIREVGKKLGVETVLEGSVQRQGDRIRITAQLIGIKDGFHFWSQQFDEKPDDIFGLYDKISNSIAERLELSFSSTSRHRPTPSREAYELYLKGRFSWNKRLPAELKKGIEFFNQAIDIDPLYAEAYSGVADCFTALGWGSFLEPSEAFPKAYKAAEKAIVLDSLLAEPHSSMGYYKLYYERNWVEAEKEFLRAIELNPKYELAYNWYGTYLTAMGRFEEARAIIGKAVELDPISPVFSSDMGFTLFYSGNTDESIKALQSTLELSPNYPIAHLWLSRAYQQKKKYNEAISEYRKTLQVITDWSVALAGIGNIYGEIGEKQKAQGILDTLVMLSNKQYVTPYGVALVFAGLNDKDNAFHWLDKAYEERSNFLVWLKVDPRWNPIRSDKRFEELIRRVGLSLDGKKT